MIEVFNISQDDDESDTSQEDLDESAEENQDNLDCKMSDFDAWKRKPVPESFFEKHKDFRLFLMDCDFGIISTQSIPKGLIPFESPVTWPSRCRLPPICKEQSYIRLHGITETGNSVCCNVFGYLPYFFAAPSVEFNAEYIQQFKTLLTNTVIHRILSSLNTISFHDMVQNSPIVSVEVFNVNDFNNIYGLQHSGGRNDKHARFTTTNTLKITCALPKFVWTAAKVLKDNEITFPGIKKPCRYEVYESSINHTIRFLADTNVSCCTWLEVKAENYCIRNGETNLSYAQLEIDVYYENLTKVSQGDDLADVIPPIRILSFDIECMTRPKLFAFPRDGSERVLQIGNVLATYKSSDIPRKVVFALGECNKSDATEIFSFGNEVVMLEAWRYFILSVDPDILMGYNIKKFDIPYLIDRANLIGPKLNRFSFFGRVKANQSLVRPIKPGPKQMYGHDDKKVIVPGRIILDMFLLMMRHNTIPGRCTLADVSVRYLKTERKIDVHYTQIFKMQNLSKQSRSELAEYCIQDCILPYLLLLNHNPNPNKNPKEDMLSYYIEKARVTGTPLKYLVTKSKEYCRYFRMIRTQKNPDVPFVPDTPSPAKLKRRRRASEPSAIVQFSPKRLNFNYSVQSFDPSLSSTIHRK